jgi:hypothetical protein
MDKRQEVYPGNIFETKKRVQTDELAHGPLADSQKCGPIVKEQGRPSNLNTISRITACEVRDRCLYSPPPLQRKTNPSNLKHRWTNPLHSREFRLPEIVAA